MSDNLEEIKNYLKKKSDKKIFLITGKKSFNKSGANLRFKSLLSKINLEIYFKRSFVPEINELKKIISLIKKFKPDIILAIGGGTVIDYAKAACCTDLKQLTFKKIILGKVEHVKKYELCVIPTTAGSGAEVTSNAVIFIKNSKFSFENSNLIADNFFILPSLVLKLNQKIKASSGFDAIAQAIESLISIKSNRVSVNFAKQSLKLSIKNYLNFLKSPNKSNAFEMCLSANLSGKAINISKTTAPHAVSYPFTSYFKISHGHAVSLTLEKFLMFNYNNINYSKANFNLKDRYKTLFKITKTNSIIELIFFLKKLKREANLEDDFKKMNIDIEKNLGKILKGVNELRLKNNPINITKNDISNILLV